MMILQEWQVRVLREQVDLFNKIEKLETFIDKNGHDHLLEKQLFVMKEYNGILKQRIKDFGVVEI